MKYHKAEKGVDPATYITSKKVLFLTWVFMAWKPSGRPLKEEIQLETKEKGKSSWLEPNFFEDELFPLNFSFQHYLTTKKKKQ